MTSPRRALVLGGSGTVGAEVVRALAEAGVPTTFTHFTSAAKAQALADEAGAATARLDLRDRSAIREHIARLASSGDVPNILVHCAGSSGALPMAEVTDAHWDEALAVNCRAAFVACQALAPLLPDGGDIVLLGAMGRAQSLPLPVAFAVSQGALGALTMSLAKELGPANIRVNTLALGVLEGGLSRGLPAKTLADFEGFSALARRGTAAEVAQAVLWLALENTYMSGKVLEVNGGI